MDRVTVKLLGGLEIAGSGDAGAPALSRKARAVVAFLALQPGRPQTRERLAALFWQNSPEEQARTSLRQMLALLRKRLGPALLTEADTVSLDGTMVDTDVARFDACLDSDDPAALEDAAALYRGDLLEGFSIREAAFEDWVLPLREHCRSRMIDGLIRMIGDDGAQNFAQVLTVAPRLLALDPLNEAAHRKLMRAYAGQGRHAAALKQFELCRSLLNRELGVQPEPATVSLFEELRRQRAKGPATCITAADPAEAQLPPPAADRPSIAVLPFENRSGDPDQAYFSDGITEDIITELSRFRSLFVIARSSSFAFRDPEAGPAEVGRRLGVRYLVEGSVRKAGNRVRVTAQLAETATGSQIWAEHYDRDLDDIFAVQDEVARTVVATLAGRLEHVGREHARQKPPANRSAYDFFLRGRQHYYRWKAGDNLIAEQMYRNAIALDPDYAPAHAGLAETLQNAYGSGWSADPAATLAAALQQAERAVALDETDSRTHTALGGVRLFGRDFDRARFHLDRAVALNPNDTRAVINHARFFVFYGEPDYALPRMAGADRLDPFGKHGWYKGFAHYTARNYGEAIRALGSLREPAAIVRAWLAAAYAQAGLDDKAETQARKCLAAARAEAAERGIAPIASWIGWMRGHEPYRNSSDLENLTEGMRKAGLP